ncbi:MAG TPA: hypothetical protein EYQ50_27630 [Verrucomicrobiales bacterium]|nr:hypothetical protein [Verrucomicrobiales bacterium]
MNNSKISSRIRLYFCGIYLLSLSLTVLEADKKPLLNNIKIYKSIHLQIRDDSNFNFDEIMYEYSSTDSLTSLLMNKSDGEQYILKLPEAYRFDFQLIDGEGNRVSKTKKGKDVSRKVKVGKPLDGERSSIRGKFKGVFLSRKTKGYADLFRPIDVFSIESDGEYFLEFHYRFVDDSGIIQKSKLIRVKIRHQAKK